MKTLQELAEQFEQDTGFTPEEAVGLLQEELYFRINGEIYRGRCIIDTNSRGNYIIMLSDDFTFKRMVFVTKRGHSIHWAFTKEEFVKE